MSDDDDGNNDQVRWSLLDRPYAYVIFPLIVVFIIAFVAIILLNRRRRRRLVALHGHNWPGGRQDPNARIPSGLRGRRHRGARAPWGGTRSQEGLNELGEAPPPYVGKRAEEEEMRDLERGQGTTGGTDGSNGDGRPPEYISEPGPAVVRPGNRWS